MRTRAFLPRCKWKNLQLLHSFLSGHVRSIAGREVYAEKTIAKAEQSQLPKELKKAQTFNVNVSLSQVRSH